MASTLKTDNLSTLSGTGEINVLQSLGVNGSIDFTGNLLQNGQPFVTLPEQSIETMGAMLASDGVTAYWAHPNTFENNLGSTNMPPTDADTGGINLQNPTVPNSGRLPFDGTGNWYDYQGNSYSINIGSEFKYRSIFTHGFLMGGYRGANPWRTVNQTFHATDVTICRGDQLDRAATYVDGNFGDYNGYVYGGNNGWGGNSAHTSSINLHTGTGRTAGSSPSYNTTDNLSLIHI